mmetsp:Transcript_6353/g.7864  ORF Transcript_6353/g.7864 Transcript_6353/m.7864 type:complete len:320 (-) Transcript_6353:45-1004(-)|eukprot:CAMPEP_0203665542 /NCGR_PEP_ID=MMETSP0090-20130426/2749_1 /ASSEMBLY_ACC=CAM_ASM_001088 /TAXON_ID=426623 /ORGANISM="Chaetoceros affinis, Strain CCMP159" /LENGTH=319 /DNA_ID=CAMNT_0050529139 /DNA_START=109 /DNA_END=1068 /DNA_ORIENTATION=+
MAGPETPLLTLVGNSDHLAVLRHIRAHKLQKPGIVVEHGQYLLQSKSWNSSLAQIERLACLEQIFVAALEVLNIDLAKDALKQIQKEINDGGTKDSAGSTSARYRKLVALSLEFDEDFDTALEVYNNMLQENPSNSYAHKRKYCVLKSQGKSAEAREVLNSYLEENGMDVGAWVEMAESCLDVGDYNGAAYCYEEILLSSPLDSNVHCMLGELYVTIGGKENLKLARKHLAQSLELDPNNVRALFGIVSAAETYLQLVDLSEANNKSNSKKKKMNKSDFDEDDVQMAKDLYEYGAGKLSNVYKGTYMSSLLEMILEGEE